MIKENRLTRILTNAHQCKFGNKQWVHRTSDSRPESRVYKSMILFLCEPKGHRKKTSTSPVFALDFLSISHGHHKKIQLFKLE